MSTFHYNQPVSGLSPEDTESFYYHRSYKIAKAFELALITMKAFHTNLKHDQLASDSEYEQSLLSPQSTDAEKIPLAADLKRRYQRAIETVQNRIEEVRELKKYFGSTHCLNATPDQLGRAVLIFKGASGFVLHQLSLRQFTAQPDGSINFNSAEPELYHLIVYQQCLNLLGNQEEVRERIHSYPFNVWD